MTQQNYPNVYKLLSNGDEDVTMQDIINDMVSVGLSENDLPIMEASLVKMPRFTEGLPFPGDEQEYDQLLKTDKGLQLLQKFMDFWG